eukprot:1311417-Pleurochrysis_carterae.AAC.4
MLSSLGFARTPVLREFCTCVAFSAWKPIQRLSLQLCGQCPSHTCVLCRVAVRHPPTIARVLYYHVCSTARKLAGISGEVPRACYWLVQSHGRHEASEMVPQTCGLV